MTCRIFSSPEGCPTLRESAGRGAVQPVTRSRAAKQDQTATVITHPESRTKDETEIFDMNLDFRFDACARSSQVAPGATRRLARDASSLNEVKCHASRSMHPRICPYRRCDQRFSASLHVGSHMNTRRHHGLTKQANRRPAAGPRPPAD